MAFTGSVTPCYTRLKNSTVFKRFEAALAEFDFHKIQCQLGLSRLNTFVYVLEQFSCEKGK